MLIPPAYDLCFAPGPGGEHTMTVAGEGRAPNREHVLQLAKQFNGHHRRSERWRGEVAGIRECG